MSEISKKVAYIKGMAEGMELTEDTAKDAKDKLLLQMLDALDLIAEELDSIRDRQDEAERYIDELDSDLGELEEAVFEEDDEDEDDDCGCGCHHHHGQDEDKDEDEEEDEDEDDSLDFIEYECPHCGTVIFFDENAFDMEEEHLCPNCHRKVFEDDGEDGDDEE